jgi:hypothetical protein
MLRKPSTTAENESRRLDRHREALTQGARGETTTPRIPTLLEIVFPPCRSREDAAVEVVRLPVSDVSGVP